MSYMLWGNVGEPRRAHGSAANQLICAQIIKNTCNILLLAVYGIKELFFGSYVSVYKYK
jgi:hypothetical protein